MRTEFAKNVFRHEKISCYTRNVRQARDKTKNILTVVILNEVLNVAY